MSAPIQYQMMPPAGSEGAPYPRKDEGKEQQSRAKIVIEVPEDAKLFIDDQLMKTTSTQRAFATPMLDEGQAYYYIVRAEVIREGKTYEQTRRVIVRAGEQVKTSLNDLQPVTGTATARAPLRR
jgi:uncharacterized protein (TIGR03000 family)